MRYLAPHRLMVAGALVSAVLASALSLTPPIFIKMAVDSVVLAKDASLLWLFTLGIVGTSIAQGGFDFLVRYLAEAAGHKAIYDIRSELYTHLNELSFSYFDRQNTGDIISRVTADADDLQHFFGFAAVYITTNILILLGILVVLFAWSPALALLYLTVSPFLVHGMTRYTLKVRPLAQKTRRVLGKLNSVLHQELMGVQVLKILGAEERSVRIFNRQNQEFYSVNVEAGRVNAIWIPYVFVLMGWGTGLVLWYGGRYAILGGITLGTLTGFISYVGMLMRPVRQTGMLLGQSINAITSAARVFEVLDTEPEVKDSPNAVRLKRVEGKVELQNVSFAYDKGNPVIKDVSMTVSPGETVAIVGPTGAGKTTLVHLIGRFYDAERGRVLLDGQDVREVALRDLRRNIGIVLQETFLFSGNIAENIGFGRPMASDKDILEAARAAQIHDFISSLPDGYQSRVGERGVNLSGGQRQRISIARTLLADPRVLILDEPTSNVDAETEERITTALDHLFRGRTVFVIAHRLWTAKNADRILVIEGGKIVQSGPHDTLVSEVGPYRDLYSGSLSGETHSPDL
ncbi:MAG: ABC transporter ATP-binding protein [Bacillota bacterium]